MSEASTSHHYTADEVLDFLEDGEGDDDQLYFPGSDEELGLGENLDSDDSDGGSGPEDDLSGGETRYFYYHNHLPCHYHSNLL